MIQGPSGAGEDATVDWWYSVVLGLVEGLTEFLPVSSTGHLIVASRAFGRSDPAFEIGIQMGAITAILILYWGRVFGAVRGIFSPAPAVDGGARPVNLIWLLFLAALPAAVIGLLCKDSIEELLFNPTTVGITLIGGGVGLLVLEWWERRREVEEAEKLVATAMTPTQAVQIGLFQCLALIPGMSRSGATIAGGMLLGFQRTAAAEFSFLVGLPVLYGASLVQLRDHTGLFTDPVRCTEFVIASVAAFLSAILVVKPFVHFLQRHTFVPFGWYRIVAGAALLWWMHSGTST